MLSVAVFGVGGVSCVVRWLSLLSGCVLAAVGRDVLVVFVGVDGNGACGANGVCEVSWPVVCLWQCNRLSLLIECSCLFGSVLCVCYNIVFGSCRCWNLVRR